MPEYWLDYSAARLSGKVIRDNGYTGVIRYIDAPNQLRMKHTTPAEYADHIANGLHVMLVMQNTTTDADGGYPAGVANAQRAKAGADALGYQGIIFFTNDRTTVPNPQAWQAYLDGAATVLGPQRVGAYGFANAMDLARGRASAFWQAGRYSELRGHTNFYQDNNVQVTVGGVLCDRNMVISVPSGTTAPINPIEDEDDYMLVPATHAPGAQAGDDYVSIPCNGKTLLFISTGFGRTVKVLSAVGVKDNNGKGTGEYSSVQPLDIINPDQPGPLAVAPGTRVVQLRYSADHPFTAWCA